MVSACRKTCIGLLGVFSGVGSGLDIQRSARGQIVPALEPTSHDKFFDKDNSWDDRNGATDFKYPFPSVQHSFKYDDDFVRDENSDGGQWQAQMEYDTARTNLNRQREKVAAARSHEKVARGTDASADAQKDFNQQKGAVVDDEKALREAEDRLRAVRASLLQVQSEHQVVPALEPASHKEFFDEDNSWDDRSGATNFRYPFPSVQHSFKYDSDFVGDENTDGGQWQAQLEYDAAKVSLTRQIQKGEEAHHAEEVDSSSESQAAYNLAKGAIVDGKKAVQKAEDQLRAFHQ